MSLRRDIDVAGVQIKARDVPELIRRLHRAGYPTVAYKVERALSVRTVKVEFNAAEREALVRSVRDRPPPFSDLYRELLHELRERGKGSPE